MSNNNNYSPVAEAYRNNRNNGCICNNNSNDNDDFDNGNNRNRNECCGRRFNNCPNDENVRAAMEAFAKQLNNTAKAIDCLNKLFNNLEDDIFEDRCCVSNRVKNILRSIQSEICDLEDGVRNIGDDLECLNQAL